MPINFFEQGCHDSSSNTCFGLCDDLNLPGDRAYIDEVNRDIWTATVENPDGKLADFYAIDHCVELLNPLGGNLRRCDGMLVCENKIKFVELKDRDYKGWLGSGREQLTETIASFAANHSFDIYDSVSAVLANSQRPKANANYAIHLEQFNDKMDELGIPASFQIDPIIKI